MSVSFANPSAFSEFLVLTSSIAIDFVSFGFFFGVCVGLGVGRVRLSNGYLIVSCFSVQFPNEK